MKNISGRPPSAGNVKPPNYIGLVTPDMAAFDVYFWQRDVNALSISKTLPAELYRIDSAYPVPWYNLNPISQGIKQMSNNRYQDTSVNDREGSNRV